MNRDLNPSRNPRNGQYLYNADGQICAVHNMTGMTEYIYGATGATGEVTVSDLETKGFPSVNLYLYDSAGDATDIWEQIESGNVSDLWGPHKPAKNQGRQIITQQASVQWGIRQHAI
jgi:hypothetical protein